MSTQGHGYSDPTELAETLRLEFNRNHVYMGGVGSPDVERLQRQLDAITGFRDREIALGHDSDRCSAELWDATTALRERVASAVISSR